MVCYGSAAANRLFDAMKRLWSSMVRCPEAKLSQRLSKNPQDRSRLVVLSQPLGVVRWRLQNLQKLQIVGSRASTTHSLHWRRRLATKMLRYIKQDTKTLRGARLTPWAEIFPAPKGMKVRQVSADQIWPAESPRLAANGPMPSAGPRGWTKIAKLPPELAAFASFLGELVFFWVKRGSF